MVALALLGFVSCSPEPLTGDGLLGIARVEVERTETTLAITALDEGGAQIGHAKLETGPFVMEDDGRAVVGRKLAVDVLGEVAFHESEGFRALKLPLTGGKLANVSAFLVHPKVEQELAAWGVGFQVRPQLHVLEAAAPRSSEAKQWACTYATTSQCGAIDCAESNQNFFQAEGCGFWAAGVDQYVCCGNTMRGGQRQCGMGANNGCGAEGTNGCASCWSIPYSEWCATSSMVHDLECTDYGMPNGNYMPVDIVSVGFQ